MIISIGQEAAQLIVDVLRRTEWEAETVEEAIAMEFLLNELIDKGQLTCNHST